MSESRSRATVGHVVGEGGKCWCGEVHHNYVYTQSEVDALLAGAYLAAQEAVDRAEKRFQRDSSCKEADCGCWAVWVQNEIATLTTDAAHLALEKREKRPLNSEQKKPCYCLGMATIRKVAEEGQIVTDSVDFVAADDLFKQKVYTESELAEREAKLAADTRREALTQGECGVSGHFKFQMNGSSCLMCQRESRLVADTLRAAVDTVDSCGGNEHSGNLLREILGLASVKIATLAAERDRRIRLEEAQWWDTPHSAMERGQRLIDLAAHRAAVQEGKDAL